MQKKKISMGVTTAVGLGAIIGAGIFVLSGTAIALAGSMAIVSFLIVGIIAVMVAMQIGELGALFPNAKGASYSFVYEAFGSELGFITGILLYICYATAMAAVALGFGTYLSGALGLQGAYPIVCGIGLILALALVNMFGIRKAAKVDSYLVIVKIAILLLFIAFAVFAAFYLGKFVPSNFAIDPTKSGLGAVFAASVAIFFAYSGFQTIGTFTSEVKGGPRSAARAILLAVTISIIIYVGVVISLLLLLPSSAYTISADPLLFALTAAGAPGSLITIVTIGALVATTSAALAMMLISSRVMYQISEDGLLPRFMRKYNVKNDAATNGILITAVIAIITLFAGNVYVIAAISNFGLLVSYLMSSFALIHFRRTNKPAEYRAPLYPYLSILTIIGLLLFMIGMPQESLVIGVIVIITLIVVYYAMRELERKSIIRVRLFD